MKATIVPKAYSILGYHTLDGKMVFEIQCRSYKEFMQLPQVLSYSGTECMKTGWSSDTDRACYKESKLIAKG